ncbi:hypothetical protein MFRU_006g03200 [Monilinia fructicola]|nr:hypothetical protein MFRU_006g03200 [Monilinia fructicola]
MLHYFILSLTIGKYVFSEILMTPYPIGVTEPQQATFLSIEEEMSRMGKAKSKITQWRSDTLTALCSSKSYQDEQKRQLLSIQNALGKDLSFWCGNSGYQRLKDRLHREIIDPSVRVHQEMKCSTRKYDLIRESDAQFKRSSSSEQYASHIVKEVKTWKTMTSDGTERVLQCLYPGIVVYDMEAEERSELLGPVMAVYKRASPQARRSATSSARSSFHAEISMKEPRDHGHHKIATNAPKRIGSSINAFVEGISRKSKDDRRSPEPSSSHPSRRASRDTSTKQVQYSSLSYGQTVSYSQSTQPTEDMPIPFAPSAYTRTVTGVPCEGATAEVVEPREMTYTSSPEEWSDYYHGRPSVPDGTYIERFDE